MIEKTQLQKIHEKIFGEEQNFQATLDLIDTKIPKLGNIEYLLTFKIMFLIGSVPYLVTLQYTYLGLTPLR